MANKLVSYDNEINLEARTTHQPKRIRHRGQTEKYRTPKPTKITQKDLDYAFQAKLLSAEPQIRTCTDVVLNESEL